MENLVKTDILQADIDRSITIKHFVLAFCLEHNFQSELIKSEIERLLTENELFNVSSLNLYSGDMIQKCKECNFQTLPKEELADLKKKIEFNENAIINSKKIMASFKNFLKSYYSFFICFEYSPKGGSLIIINPFHSPFC